MLASTRRLTSAPLQVVSDLRARTIMRTVLVSVLLALGLLLGLRLLNDGASGLGERARLQHEVSSLRAKVSSLQAELQIERATHAGLDQQVAQLSDRAADLERQLAFVQSQRDRARPASQAQ